MHSYIDIEQGQGAVWLSRLPEVLIIANGGWTLTWVNVTTVSFWYLTKF